MADTFTSQIQQNGYRNFVLKMTYVADLTAPVGLSNQLIFDATSANSLSQNPGVLIGGQTFYPGVHLSILRLHYDVANTQAQLTWDSSSGVGSYSAILTLGAAPGPMDWTDLGGLRVTPGMTNPTGSLRLSTINPAAGATMDITLYLRKNIVT